MKEFIEYLVKNLVDNPDDVVVTQVESDDGILFQIKAHADDLAKVIGRKGRMINALRVLMTSCATRAGVRARLEIAE